MLPLCIDLDIDIWPLKSTAPVEQLEFQYWNRVPNDWVNPQIVDFLDSINITFKVIDCFHLKPFRSSLIHIDSHDINFSLTKLNWSTNSPHSMNFYTYKNKSETVLYEKTKIDNTNSPGRHVCFDLADLDPAFSHVIKSPTLLDGNIPHQVINGPKLRTCYSIAVRYKDKNDNNFIPYNDAIEIFKPYIKIE